MSIIPVLGIAVNSNSSDAQDVAAGARQEQAEIALTLSPLEVMPGEPLFIHARSHDPLKPEQKPYRLVCRIQRTPNGEMESGPPISEYRNISQLRDGVYDAWTGVWMPDDVAADSRVVIQCLRGDDGELVAEASVNVKLGSRREQRAAKLFQEAGGRLFLDNAIEPSRFPPMSDEQRARLLCLAASCDELSYGRYAELILGWHDYEMMNGLFPQKPRGYFRKCSASFEIVSRDRRRVDVPTVVALNYLMRSKAQSADYDGAERVLREVIEMGECVKLSMEAQQGLEEMPRFREHHERLLAERWPDE